MTVSKKAILTPGTVVEEFNLGNTRIKICNDAYINRTQEEIDQSIKRLNAICHKCVTSSGYKKSTETEQEPGDTCLDEDYGQRLANK